MPFVFVNEKSCYSIDNLFFSIFNELKWFITKSTQLFQLYFNVLTVEHMVIIYSVCYNYESILTEY